MANDSKIPYGRLTDFWEFRKFPSGRGPNYILFYRIGADLDEGSRDHHLADPQLTFTDQIDFLATFIWLFSDLMNLGST